MAPMNGTLRYAPPAGRGPGHWVIAARPHVVLRAKRVFQRVATGASGAITITCTQEVCRDLAWFLERYPLTMTPADKAVLRRGARAHVEREDAVQAILAEGYAPKVFPMAEPPYAFQRVAADLALRTGSLLLADDLGLGKTITALCVLTDPRARPALVVTQANLTAQWAAQAARFVPDLHVHVLEKGTPYDLRNPPRRRGAPPDPRRGAMPDVLICNYHKIAGWAPVLAALCKGVVFDEAQELRRTDSDKYVAAKQIAAACDVRIGLSATPIYNYGSELHAVCDVLRPDALGTAAEFAREWCVSSDAVRDPRSLGTYARAEGLMLRRTRSDVRREIPSLSVVPYAIPSDDKALDEAAGPAAELARILLAGPGSGQARGEALSAAKELSMRLRQATGLAKAPYVADFVRLLVESGEPVVLFGWHRAVYGVWLERLKDLRPVLYTGSETPKEKEANKQAFLEGKAKVLIMSLRAGAGLDGLQHGCRTVVFGELDWSPQVHGQCTGRVHRDGQRDPVAAYYLITDNGSDPVVADVLGIKRAQSDGILDPEAEGAEAIAPEDALIVSDDDDGDDGRAIGIPNIKRLAEAFLRERGLPLPTPTPEPKPCPSSSTACTT